MVIGVLKLVFFLPGCTSLKEKRSRIKPVISRLHREFNLTVAEVERQDAWQVAVIAVGMISNDPAFLQSSFQTVIRFIEAHFPDISLTDQTIELI